MNNVLRTKWLLTLLCACLFLVPANTVLAQLISYDGTQVSAIGKDLEYYVDKTNAITIAQVAQVKEFQRGEREVNNLGIINGNVWLRFNIQNNSSRNEVMLEISQALLDSIDLYEMDNGTTTLLNSAGLAYDFSSRLINNHNFLYPLQIPKGSTKTFYARISAHQQLSLPIYVGPFAKIQDSGMSKNMWFGIFFGIIAVMFFYNLFIYFTVKDKIYLYYVVYILVVGLVQATIEGYAFQYLWPGNTFLATRAFYLFTALVNITGLEFVRRFLHTRKYLPQIERFFALIYVFYAAAIFLALKGNFILSYYILQGFAGVVALYMLTISIIIARKGYRPAKFFVAAWIPLIIGIFIYVLKDVGAIGYSIFSNYSIAISSVLEVVLLSFALADSINALKKENEQAQADALRISRENERIIREQNVILESRVNDRTIELKESNEELNKTLHDLKEAEAHLVESEKMASLGQLTAGIAHEINNPINFVTSNVHPLKRDVEILMEAVQAIEAVSLEDTDVAEKQKKIKEYKEGIDFDYLKVEIDHLLKGINEGASRTAEIVKGLRVFSRLDEDDLKKADMNEGLDSTLIIINNLLGKTKVVKEYAELPPIECYPGKLNQVFMNVITNGIHAVDDKFKGEAGGIITIKTSHDEKNVYINIADNGTGMTEETRKKLFEPFFTTKEVGSGTGLGLSISWNTIKKHNGNIVVNSTLGEGSEFIFELPIMHQSS
ncbi:MAG: GHKL domain-containing protein [Flavipsychrobacter sp.]|nr:GHKL domain-containing protein [Flavipsychrobacter sp.]